MVTEMDVLPRSTVEIVDNAGNIVRNLVPVLEAIKLGELAIVGPDNAEKWLLALKEEGEQLAVAAAAITDFATQSLEERDQAERTPEPQSEAEDTFESQDDLTLIEDIDLSDNESAGLVLALKYLKANEGFLSINDLLMGSFGRMRMPPGERERFVEILSNCVSKGVIQRVGNTFAYGSDPNQFTAESAVDKLNEPDRALYDYIKNNQKWGRVTLENIVHEHKQANQLPTKEFQALLTQLDFLEMKGLIVPVKGSSAFRLVKEIAIDTPSMSIETPALSERIESPALSERMEPESRPDKKLTAEKTTKELSDLGQQIFDFARTAGPIGVELLRKNIAILQAMTDEEYAQFKLAFSEIRDEIIEHQGSIGTKARWEQSGAKRGTKYELIIDEEGINATTLEPLVEGQSVVIPKPSSDTRKKSTAVRGRGVSPRASLIEQHRDAVFAHRLLNNIVRFIDSSPNGVAKKAVLKQHVAKGLGIPESHASGVIDDFASSSDLFKGNLNGYAVVSRGPVAEGNGAKESKSKEKRNVRWTRRIQLPSIYYLMI